MMEQSEIDEFNQKFLNYKGRNDLTVQDVVTIINLAKDGTDGPNAKASVTVKLDGNPVTSTVLVLLSRSANSTKPEKYTCQQVTVDTDTLLVKEVQIKTNSP